MGHFALWANTAPPHPDTHERGQTGSFNLRNARSHGRHKHKDLRRRAIGRPGMLQPPALGDHYRAVGGTFFATLCVALFATHNSALRSARRSVDVDPSARPIFTAAAR